MKKVVFFLALILLSANVIALESFEVYQTAVKDEVYPGEQALYQLTIKNNQKFERVFLLYSDDFARAPFSDVIESIFLEPSQIKVPGNSEKDVAIKVNVLRSAVPNTKYRTSIKVVHFKEESYAQEAILLSVMSPREPIKIETTLPDNIIPEKGSSFDLTLSSIVNLNYKEVEVFVTSSLSDEKFSTPLYYGIPVTRTINLNLDSGTMPGIYALSIKVYYNKILKASYEKKFGVDKNPYVKETEDVESEFLLVKKEITKKNEGNLEVDEEVVVPMGAIQGLFVLTTPGPSEKTEEGFKWAFNLRPNETYKILVTTDYRALFVGLITAMLLIIVVIYIKGQKVVVKKGVYRVGEKSGGISELKVLLHVKNKSKAEKNVKLMDILPSLIKPTQEFGTLSPSKIQKGEHGTKITWEIPGLKKGEERIISYTVLSGLPIVGGVTLPRALVRYQKGNRSINVLSNRGEYYPKK